MSEATSGFETQLRTGLTWAQMADGLVWRLKSGKHFPRGGLDRIRQEALMAAADLEKAVVLQKDDLGKWQYLWVQFVDDEIAVGSPCPTCGGRRIIQVHKRFGRCPVCGATLVLITTRGSGGGSPRRDLSRYTELRLKPVRAPAGRQRFVGYGKRFDGEPRLIEVDFFIGPDGQRQEDPARPGEYLYRMRTLTAGPFLEVLDLEAFADEHSVDPLNDDEDDD